MSKVYNIENQVILRVPSEISKRINDSIKNEDSKNRDFIELIPFYENLNDSDSLKFQYYTHLLPLILLNA